MFKLIEKIKEEYKKFKEEYKEFEERIERCDDDPNMFIKKSIERIKNEDKRRI